MMEKLRINSMERWRPVRLGLAAMYQTQAAHHRNGDANPVLSHGSRRRHPLVATLRRSANGRVRPWWTRPASRAAMYAASFQGRIDTGQDRSTGGGWHRQCEKTALTTSPHQQQHGIARLDVPQSLV